MQVFACQTIILLVSVVNKQSMTQNFNLHLKKALLEKTLMCWFE
jgi:hypothetical protein